MNRQLPNGWRIESFQKVVFDKTGGNPKVKQRDYRKSGVLPVIDQGQTCVAGYVDDVSLECKAARPCIIFGDHTKTLKFVDTPFVLGADGTKVLVPSSKLYPKYLYYYLRQVKLPDDVGYSRHFKFLKEVMIPIPPLDTQKRIADALDKAQEVIDKRKQQIELLDELLQSVFLDMFGDPVTNPCNWNTRRLEDYITFMTSGSRGWAKYYSDDGELFLRINNVKGGKLLLDDRQFVRAPQNQEAIRTRVQEHDVLVSITADIGRTAVVDRETASFGAYINQHLCLVRVDRKKILPGYLSSFLESPGGRIQFIRRDQVGVKSGLNFNAIKSLEILSPPLSLQEKYLNHVSLIERQRFLLQKSLAEMQNLFNSIMQRAFKGELFS